MDVLNGQDRGPMMKRWMMLTGILAGLWLGPAGASAEEAVTLSELIAGMPKGEQQQIRVLMATLKPGETLERHTHRFPVTSYILQGAFTLELEGRPPVTVRAGEAMVEPPNVKMIAANRSATEPLRIVTFYVSDPDTPFLDPVH